MMANLVQSLMRQETASPIKSVSFQPGQVFNGKVTKLFPNQTAEVQVGSQKIIAQLEAPLMANERYWLQVQPGEGQVHLKVLTMPNGNSPSASFEGLLQQLSLPATKENIEIIKFLTKEQQPISIETLKSAALLLKNADSFKEGMEAIKQILNRQLPLTKDTFLGVQANLKNEPMHTLLMNLEKILDETPHSATGSTLRTLVSELSSAGKKQFSDNALTELVKTWLDPKANFDSKTSLKLLQSFGFLPEGDDEAMVNRALDRLTEGTKNSSSNLAIQTLVEPSQKTAVQQAIQKLLGKNETLPAPLSIQSVVGQQDQSLKLPGLELLRELTGHFKSGDRNQFLSGLNQLKLEMENMLQNGNQDLLKSTANQLQQAINSSIGEEGLISEKSLHLAVKSWMTTILSDTQMGVNEINRMTKEVLSFFNGKQTLSDSSIELLVKTMTDGEGKHLNLTNEELSLLGKVKDQVQGLVVNWENGKDASQHLKSLIRSLGLGYENEALTFMKGNQEEQHKLDTLKPLLIKMLNEDPPPSLREASEQLLNKITGLQVLSHDVGPMQQFAIQIPISLWNRTTDLTIQWNGRKKEDGKIDPDYCRVLFYLELDHLKETVVDVQVQNRIMNISIINDIDGIKQVAAPFVGALKENLTKLKYHLSSVTFESSKKETIQQKRVNLSALYQSSNYSGVDIKI